METSFRKVNSEIGTSNFLIQFLDPISWPASQRGWHTSSQRDTRPARPLDQPAIQPASQPVLVLFRSQIQFLCFFCELLRFAVSQRLSFWCMVTHAGSCYNHGQSKYECKLYTFTNISLPICLSFFMQSSVASRNLSSPRCVLQGI